MEHIGERPADAGRSLFTAFPPSCMKQKDEIRRSSSWETAHGLMENRGVVRRPAALPAHVERLAKALGLEVVVEERLQPTVKGYIQGNAIHLPPSSPDAAMEILRHELTHRMQELIQHSQPPYRNYVMRQYTAADAAAKYEAYRRAGHPLTPEQVVDELVAEYAGRHLREEGAIRRLAGENRTLAEWVRGSIRALAERIREKLGRAEPTLEHAQRLWERAFRAAEQHASRQNPSVPLPGPETPARYSIREEIDSSHSGEYTGETTGKGDSKIKSIEDILEGAEETTNNAGVVRNFEKTGGFTKTLKDFDALNQTDVKDIQTQYGTGKVGKLNGGISVIARPGSKTGGATLEIKISNSKIYKIRY